MVIRKQDIKKHLKFDDGGEVIGDADTSQARTGGRSSGRPYRSARNAGSSKDVVNLGAMSSGSFMNLLDGVTVNSCSENEDDNENASVPQENKNENAIVRLGKKNDNAFVLQENMIEKAIVSKEKRNDNAFVLQENMIEKAIVSKEKRNDNAFVLQENKNENAFGRQENKKDTASEAISGTIVAKNAERQSHPLVDKDKQSQVPNPHVESFSTVEVKTDEIRSESQDTSTFLDTTMPLFVDTQSQTDQCFLLCTCIKCKDIVQKFSTYMCKGYGDDCVYSNENVKGAKDLNGSGLTFNTSLQQGDDQLIPLYKGCSTNISVTCKGKLKILDKDPNSTDRDYVYAIMDDLFEPSVLANMTAEGRTPGSTKMDPKIKDTILIYLQNKFTGVDKLSVNESINAKCYCERRKLWGKNSEQVRKPLVKNKKKQKETESSLGDGESNENAKKDKGSDGEALDQRFKRRKGDKNCDEQKRLKRRRSKSKSKSSSSKKKAVPQVPYSPSPKQMKKKKVKNDSHDHPTKGNKRPRSVQDILDINTKEQTDFELSPIAKKIKKKTHEPGFPDKQKDLSLKSKHISQEVKSHKTEFWKGMASSSTPKHQKTARGENSKKKEKGQEQESDDNERNQNETESEADDEEEEIEHQDGEESSCDEETGSDTS
ncbi:uncharacterized protein LOC117642008 [Thrips palmi]|uniref:Uncharacterized protein LOC117642008 n=1 Tax=Thrips palmi TaxID=161013 RepID=A0A6P8ZJN1_THRPL|nr:uncharacterized protein LOC117642008 [Thrips palmi]